MLIKFKLLLLTFLHRIIFHWLQSFHFHIITYHFTKHYLRRVIISFPILHISNIIKLVTLYNSSSEYMSSMQHQNCTYTNTHSTRLHNMHSNWNHYFVNLSFSFTFGKVTTLTQTKSICRTNEWNKWSCRHTAYAWMIIFVHFQWIIEIFRKKNWLFHINKITKVHNYVVMNNGKGNNFIEINWFLWYFKRAGNNYHSIGFHFYPQVQIIFLRNLYSYI